MAGIMRSISIAYNSNVICNSCMLDKHCWILDSGASDHMSFDEKALHDLCLFERPVTVSLPNGHKVQVTHHGKLRLNDSVELSHVLLVPHFKFNLLSVKKLTKQLHCHVIFTENLCILQGPSLKRPVAIGKEDFGLYILDQKLVTKMSECLLESSFVCNKVSDADKHCEVACN